MHNILAKTNSSNLWGIQNTDFFGYKNRSFLVLSILLFRYKKGKFLFFYFDNKPLLVLKKKLFAFHVSTVSVNGKLSAIQKFLKALF